jgi:hypothetical protein
MTGFYTLELEDQVLVTLFHGWGYSFYKAENQLRADDLMVRAKVGEMLAAARASVCAAEAAFRRAHLPPPTRERPRPDPEALLRAQALEAIAQSIGALEGQIRALPVPANDRMTERLRTERETLEKLLKADRAMVSAAHQLRELLVPGTDDRIRQNEASVQGLLAALSSALVNRRDLLQAPS